MNQLDPHFQTALMNVIDGWTAMNLAVENEWGGVHSYRKKQTILAELFEYFQSKRNMNEDSLADFLSFRMSEYLNVNLEDDSDYEVASLLIKVFLDCEKGDYTLAHSLLNLRAPNATTSSINTNPNRQQSGTSSGESMSDDNSELDSVVSGQTEVLTEIENYGLELNNNTHTTAFQSNYSNNLNSDEEGWVRVRPGRRKNH